MTTFKRTTSQVWAVLGALAVMGSCMSCGVELELINPPQKSEEAEDEDDSPIDTSPFSAVLEGEKTYKPSRWYIGQIKTNRFVKIVIPRVIKTVKGSFGNHWTHLTFSGGTVCSYRGNSSQAHPRGAHQISLGEEATLSSCFTSGVRINPVGGLYVGEGEIIGLHVNGSHKHGPTEVIVEIVEAE